MSSAILECADITKSFGGVPVLKGITLDLRARARSPRWPVRTARASRR